MKKSIRIKVSDNGKGNSSKPVSGAHIDGKVIYASKVTTEPFSDVTDNKGEMNPPHSLQIGGNSNPGTFHVNAHASAKGYKPASAFVFRFEVRVSVTIRECILNTK